RFASVLAHWATILRMVAVSSTRLCSLELRSSASLRCSLTGPPSSMVAMSGLLCPLYRSPAARSIALDGVDHAFQRLAGGVAPEVGHEQLDDGVDHLRRRPRDVGAQPHVRVLVEPVAGRQRLGVADVERREGNPAVV